MRLRRAVWILLAASTSLATTAGHQAVAHDISDGLSSPRDILVTGPRDSGIGHDGPISIERLDSETLGALAIRDGFDLENASTALRMPSSGAQVEGASIRIRGVGSPMLQLGIDPAVALYIDDVFRSRSGMLGGDLFDVESVEILKGAPVSRAAMSSTAGAVRINTRKPQLGKHEGQIEADWQSNGAKRLRAMANLPLGAAVAGRISGFRSRGNGVTGDFWHPARRQDNLDRYGLRGQVRFAPSPTTTIDIAGDISLVDESCCASIRLNGYVPAFDGSSHDRPAPRPSWRKTLINELQRSTVSDRGVAIKAQIDLGRDLRLTSISGYRNVHSRTWAEGDFTRAAILGIDTLVDIEALTQELRLSREVAANEPRPGWTIGAFLRREQNRRIRNYDWGADVPAFFPPSLGAAPGRGAVDDLSQKFESIALFADIDLFLVPALRLQAGGRLDVDRKSGRGRFDQSVLVALPRVNDRFDAKLRKTVPSWTASLRYAPDDTISTFLTYSRGYKAGGINMAREGAGLAGALTDPVFAPETVDHLEFGLSSRFWKDRAAVSLSLFLDDYHDIQNHIFMPPMFYVSNGPGANVKGVELGIDVRPAARTAVSLDVTHLDARYGWGTDLGAGGGDVGGARLGWAPDWTVALGGSTRIPLGRGDQTLFADGQLMWRDSYRAATNVSARYEVPPTWLLTLRAGIEWGRYAISAWCSNCLGTVYPEVIFNNPVDQRSTGQVALESYPGQPRRLGLTLAARLGPLDRLVVGR